MKPEDVVANDLCIGCGVCALRFPDKYGISYDSNGFLVAQFRTGAMKLSEKEEADFENICPGLGYRRSNTASKSDPMWGSILESWGGWATTPGLRSEASSGGTITGLLKYLLEQRQVDGVVAIRPDVVDPLANESVYITDPDHINGLAGSRYAPASPFLALGDVPKSARVAVVGKPCDIAGLRRLAEMGQAELPQISHYLSFFCAGTPSRQATVDAAESLGSTKTFIGGIRYRGDGWPGNFTVNDTRGFSKAMTYEESWGTILNKQLHTRCKVCQDGVGAQADVVAADNWETDMKGYPVFQESEGRSVMLARTDPGLELVSAAVRAGYIAVEEFDYKKLNEIQPSQVNRRKYARIRQLGMRAAGKMAPRFTGLPQWRWLFREPVTAARQFVGSYRRAKGNGN